uniref:Fluoride ion transporter CrcB n=1 Tax=Auxenochlorella protothecoides TaxID=3075 RepID=A0A1D2A3X0_AUXPR
MALHRDVLILTHLALWAQLGVLTRIFFSKFFVLGCSGQWGPCLTGGTYYGSLPPNLLGSLIMGALVSSSVVGLSTPKEVTLLPASHPWQKNIPLHIGLRTGYCGSLTTFGTWQVELMTEAISLNQWVNAIMAYIVGLAASLMAYIVGCHIALGIDRYLLPEREDVLAQEAAFLAEEVAAERGRRPPRISPSQAEELEVDLDLPRISSGPYPADPALADGTPKAVLGAEEGAPGPQPRPWARWRGNRTHAATALALAALTAGWAVGAGLEREHTWIRTAFFSVLLGVPGYGGRGRGGLGELPGRSEGAAVTVFGRFGPPHQRQSLSLAGAGGLSFFCRRQILRRDGSRSAVAACSRASLAPPTEHTHLPMTILLSHQVLAALVPGAAAQLQAVQPVPVVPDGHAGGQHARHGHQLRHGRHPGSSRAGVLGRAAHQRRPDRVLRRADHGFHPSGRDREILCGLPRPVPRLHIHPALAGGGRPSRHRRLRRGLLVAVRCCCMDAAAPGLAART